jgi:hypothetical protein
MYKVVTGTRGPLTLTIAGISFTLKPGTPVDLEKFFDYEFIKSCAEFKKMMAKDKRTLRLIIDSHVSLPKVNLKRDTTPGLVDLKEKANLVKVSALETPQAHVPMVINFSNDKYVGEKVTIEEPAPVSILVEKPTEEPPTVVEPVKEECCGGENKECCKVEGEHPTCEILENLTCEMKPAEYGSRELRRKTSNEIRDIAKKLGISLEQKSKIVLVREILDSVKG